MRANSLVWWRGAVGDRFINRTRNAVTHTYDQWGGGVALPYKTCELAGEGHVPFHGGDYYDARFNKRNQVVPLIVEALGGIGRRGARCLRFLARRASCRKRGRDGTRYSRFHPENYLSHHLAGIVTAAVFADARHIVEEITLLKTRVNGATPAAAAADPTE